jgi:hypothetical protein
MFVAWVHNIPRQTNCGVDDVNWFQKPSSLPFIKRLIWRVVDLSGMCQSLNFRVVYSIIYIYVSVCKYVYIIIYTHIYVSYRL